MCVGRTGLKLATEAMGSQEVELLYHNAQWLVVLGIVCIQSVVVAEQMFVKLRYLFAGATRRSTVLCPRPAVLHDPLQQPQDASTQVR